MSLTGRAVVAESKPAAAVAFVQEIARPVLRHQISNLGRRISSAGASSARGVGALGASHCQLLHCLAAHERGFRIPPIIGRQLYAIGAGDRHALAQRWKWSRP